MPFFPKFSYVLAKKGKLKFLVILNPISREKPIAISE